MGMSYEEAKEIDKKLGTDLAATHPQNPKNRGKKAKPDGDGKNEKGQNRTEAKFDEQVLAVLKAAGRRGLLLRLLWVPKRGAS